MSTQQITFDDFVQQLRTILKTDFSNFEDLIFIKFDEFVNKMRGLELELVMARKENNFLKELCKKNNIDITPKNTEPEIKT